MNRTQALAKLRPILGKSIAWRENDKALTSEDREAAGVVAVAANAKQAEIKKALYAREKEVLAADPEVQRLRLAYREAHEAADKASGLSHRRRITVGNCNGVGGISFFHVRAEGDNWQEVVDKLKQEKAA